MPLMGENELIVVIVPFHKIFVIGASGLLISPERPALIECFSLILKDDILFGLQMCNFLP